MSDLKRDIAELLNKHGVINKDTAGQVTVHINCGGVTKIVKQVEVK